MVMGNWNCRWWVSSCTHEPVPPETILVVLTAWCGTAMSKDSTDRCHCLCLGDRKSRITDHHLGNTCGPSLLPQQVPKSGHILILATVVCIILPPISKHYIQNLCFPLLLHLSWITSVIIKMNLKNNRYYLHDPTCLSSGVILSWLVVTKFCLFPIHKVGSWEAVMVNLRSIHKVYT